MDVPVLVAVTGAGEAALVAALDAAAGIIVARRCADLSEVLSAAQAGHGRVALLSADLRRLDRENLGRLASAGVAVVGVVPGGGPRSSAAVSPADARARLTALGVHHQVPADATEAVVGAAVADAVASLATGPATTGALQQADPAAALAARPDAGAGELEFPPPTPRGRLIAVWGACGAPGRTTVATTLATELAARGASTLLVDADTWSASTAQVLGLLDEAAGIAAACRASSAGTLSVRRLEELAPLVVPHLRVLTGLPRAERWPELGARSLDGVWSTSREAAEWVVVDCAAPLEQDEEIALDTAAPRRNAAALSALAAADTVVVVGAGDPIGLQRLVRALSELSEALPGSSPRVVVTKVRSSAVGPAPGRAIREVLERFAGVRDVVLVPDDRAACDAALLAGRTLTEAAPTSPAATALRDLAAGLVSAASAVDAATAAEGPTARPERARRRRRAKMPA